MNINIIIFVILAILLFPQKAFANYLLIGPGNIVLISPIIFAIKSVVISIYFNKILSLQVEYRKIIWVVFIASLMSIVPFSILSIIEVSLGVSGVIAAGTIFCILIEFAVYIPGFRENKIRKSTLFGASVFANVISLLPTIGFAL